ncbi:L-threonine dehydratase catabolic TdcB [Candidatus Sulfotelmatomonas gaucii]|uniref:L-threonine dehydratase catabolic TdcB n=1 Tax=Candidatus Sulfuritelmatomonas gaucii TaxID=2043161 RepID=A0A2N9LIE4_9BACT|nr:L-threonine dehydratase catabolic TdcB [Candidatus Sulfotelmatomonas gaucii]
MQVETRTLVSLDAIRAAAQRIAAIAMKTPLVRAAFPGISGHGTGREIWLKAESLQPIGAFKIRGASNKILQLTPAEIARGVITYSSGNHAQGVAYAAREVGAKAVIVMPSNAPAIKRAATLALGAEIVDVGPASSERLAKAEELVREHGYVVIPPYDDEQIIAGQGTCGLEIVQELTDVDLVVSPVSGGGLLSGIAAAVKQIRPQTKVFGIEPELAADTAESFRTGKIATWTAEQTSRTLADGLRTQSVGVRNFAHIQAYVDGIVTVTEAEIRAAMRAIVAATRLVPEPSGAVATAALLFHAHELPPYRKAVALVSGGNVDPVLLAQVLTESAS